MPVRSTIAPVGNKSRSFADAERWEREQYLAMTPIERLMLARELQLRVYGVDAPDVRASERALK